MEYRVTDDIEKLKAVLPRDIVRELDALGRTDELLEIVMDLGRFPTARYVDGDHVLIEREITPEEIEYVVSRVGGFDADNRGGIERTLHRISAIRNRNNTIIGLTCRIGRAVYGTTDIIKDIITEGKSVLLLGSPGVGKTTMLREAARMLGDKRRVVIVDTSNEIGGDGDVPHPAIGNARRMQVAQPTLQHEVMIEAVENHNPQVIIIDEIGRELEAQAARTIAERGVQLIGTAHGNTLENLLRNPTLSDLVGGIESVTLSDDEARRRGTQKSVLERRAPPTFDVLVEIQDRQRLVVHPDISQAVDARLRGRPLPVELRYRDATGKIVIQTLVSETSVERADPISGKTENGRSAKKEEKRSVAPTESASNNRVKRPATQTSETPAIFPVAMVAPSMVYKAPTLSKDEPPHPDDFHDVEEEAVSVASDSREMIIAKPRRETVHVYAYGIARNRLVDSAQQFEVPLVIVDDMTRANVVVTLKNHYRRRPKLIVDAEQRNIPIYVLRANTAAQIEDFLADIFDLEISDERSALEEAKLAIQRIQAGTKMVELKPQTSHIRRQQHSMAAAANVFSQSHGNEPKRYVRFYRSEEDLISL